MLSRLAESCFWMGRCIERAEGTARLLVEVHQLLVQDNGPDQARGVECVIRGLGFEKNTDSHLVDLVSVLYGSTDVPGSILGSVDCARINARSVRDALPADFFEVLNKAHMKAMKSPDPHFPGASLHEVLEGLAVVHGVFDWVSPRDEAHSFYELGCYVERIDMVGRLLNMRLEKGWPEQGPATMLRSVGGLSTYLRRHVRMNAEPVREFLLMDSVFPRSILRSTAEAELSLREIANHTSTRVEPVLQSLGLLRGQLEYADTDLNESAVDQLVSQSLKAVETTSAAVRDHYFQPVGSIVWSH
jgi:uncharacterized alpha-E superfamily protein